MRGLCECGCGRKTAIATRKRAGIRKGEPVRFITGHHLRVLERKPPSSETRAKMGASQRKRFEDPAERARAGASKRGKPLSPEHRAKVSAALKARTFTPEHLAKLATAGTLRMERERPHGKTASRWKGDQASYYAIHSWLVKHHPKTGTCERCHVVVGSSGQAGTHHAFRWHGERAYSRERADYLELCPACHNAFDKGGNYRPGGEREGGDSAC